MVLPTPKKMIDIRQSQEYAKYLPQIGWKVERIADTNYFVKTLPLVGSLLKIQRPEEIRIDTIRKLARKYRVFQIIVEPKRSLDGKYLASVGFKLAKSTYLPSRSLLIDLTQPQEKIYSSFKKDARRAIADGGEGTTTRPCSTPDEIKKFREEWKKSVSFKRYVPSAEQLIKLRKSFPKTHSLFLASHNINDKIIGGAVFTRSGKDFSYYWQAFTGTEGRATLSQYLLVYQGILWAKKQGCRLFDFEGIYDPRFPNKSWAGFTHFKKSFGGYEISYPGCYKKSRFPYFFR